MAKTSAHIDRARSAARILLNAFEQMRAVSEEYTALGAASWADLDTANFDDIDKAKFIAMWTAYNQVRIALETGTNERDLYEAAG